MSDVPDATNAANLASLENVVQNNLGLSGIAQSDWTQPQMISYIQGLSAGILQYPTEFNDATLNNATNIGGTNLNSLNLEDDSFSWSDLGQDIEDNATNLGNSVAAIGTGVSNALQSVGDAITKAGNATSNTATLLQWAIPALVVAITIFAFNTNKASFKGASFSK